MIYLDYQASTPCDKRVLEKMLPYFSEKFANAHSNHPFGESIKDDVEKARAQIAAAINAQPKDIIFTSGATESNNLAIKGAFYFYKNKPHIISSEFEHKCVLESLKFLKYAHGAEITLLKPNYQGIINTEDIEKNIKENTLMVSIIAVNNEIGTIQNLQAIGQICRKHNVLFHTDAAQALGKIPLDVIKHNISLMSLSGHKIYGPKGIGALYVATTPNRVRLSHLFHGGGQERNIRSGTLPVPLCIGLGEAAEIAIREMESEHKNSLYLRDLFLTVLSRNTSEFYVNGGMKNRVPQNLNISFKGVESESVLFMLEDIAITSVSACASEKLESSYVLKSIAIAEELSHTALRISFGRFTTAEEIQYAATRIAKAVNNLRMMSPLWNT